MTATELPDQSDLPVQRRRSGEADWTFISEPKWILSHLFAATVITLFVIAMFWQIGRRAERIELNETVAARADAVPLSILAAVQSGPPDEVDFRRVSDLGRWVDPDVVRVANRSSNGVAGEWVVGLFETDAGTPVLVNRGFTEPGAELFAPDPSAGTSIQGWMRTSRVREGLGVEDTGEGTLVPRLDVVAIEGRLQGVSVAPMWLQLDSTVDPGMSPTPVPLPDQTNGPHFSYAVQWAIFATLGAIVYSLLMRRIATTVRD